MKKYLLFFWFAVSIAPAFGQQAEITLEETLPGNQSHVFVARDEVRMTNGFSYSPGNPPPGENPYFFHAFINEDMVLPVDYADEPISIDERELNNNLPVGSTAGSHSVSLSGAATYQIPILTPPGTAGMQASVSMVYNSQAGNGLLGYGWNLSGLSSITRIGHTIYHDGEVKGIDFNDDRFALDGNRLVVINGDIYGADLSEYYTENFNASKITSHLNATGGGPLYFTVETKDGKIIEYGNTDNARVETVSTMASHVISWNINKITDRKGNYIEFVYHKSYDHTQYWIEEIRYTGNNLVTPVLEPYNSIHFYYSERDDKHTSYIAGSKLQSNVLLDHIKVFAGNSLVRNYQLNYHFDIYSHLIELEEYNGIGEKYNSTVFEWGDNDHNIAEEELDYNYYQTEKYFLDFNGDGLSDMVELYYTGGGNVAKEYYDWKYRERYHNGFSSQQSFSNSIDQYFYGLKIGDFNGDGLTDMIKLAYVSESRNNVEANLLMISNGSDFDEHLISGIIYECIDCTGGPIFRVGDFNGDNKDELLVANQDYSPVYNNTHFWEFFEETPYYSNIFSCGIDYGNYNFHDSQVLISNFIGDGKTDILVTKEMTDASNSISSSKIYNVNFQNSSLDVFYESGYPTNYHRIFNGDFNGDGKADILTWVDGTGWEIHCFDGNGAWIQFTDIPDLYDIDPMPGLNQYWYAFNVSDYNGDGLSDIIQFHKLETGNVADYNLFLNNGIDFTKIDGQVTSIGGLDFYGGSYGHKHNFLNVDFNGDGNSDIYASQGSWDDFICFFEPNNESKRIDTIANGLNQQICFDYSPLTNNQVYTKYNNAFTSSNGYLRDLLVPIYVVKENKIQNGIGGETTVSYFYEGARMHRFGKGFLGFQKRTTSVMSGSSVEDGYFVQEVSVFDNLEPYYNMVSLSGEKTLRYYESTGQDYTISQSTNVNQTKTYSVSDLLFMPYVEQATQIDKLKNDLTITANYEVDDYGNILTETINHNGEGTTSTTTIYTSDNNSWCDYLPDYVTVNRLRNGKPVYTTETDYIYRTDGLLETKRAYAHLPNSINETFDYDDFGNVTSTTISCTGEVSRSETFAYDPLGRFVIDKTNILGHQSFYTFDHRTGNMLNQTDIQGLTTTHRYDGFGRKTRTTYPDGNKSNYSLNWDMDNPEGNIVYYTQIVSDGVPLLRSYRDKLGREIIQAHQHLINAMVFSKTVYNDNGQVESVSESYFERSAPSLFTTYHYDEIGRVQQIDFPTHSETTAYDGTTTALTNSATGISKSATTDAFGLTIAVSDPTGTINYEYFSSGQTESITAPDGSIFSMTYDEYGRQDTLSDPDAGLVAYEAYTGFGELERQVHAGRSTETQYDDFGRPDIITYSYDGQTDVVDYDYVEQGNGLEQIHSISQNNGIAYTYTYDSYGRISGEQELIEGQEYENGYTYDDYSNLQTMTWPSGYTTTHSYDRGYLTETHGGDNASLLYDSPSYNVRGQLTDFVYGNGIQISLGYDSYGFPSTKRLDNGTLLEYHYHFDPGSGNLLWRNDLTNNITFLDEYFAYDDNVLKNRLTEWGEQEQEQISTLYHANGNIRCKTDISVYSPFAFQYSPVKPHALTQVNDPTAQYLDFVEGQNQEITYNAFDKTQSITQTNKRIEFVYGPDQARKIMKYMEWEKNTWALKKTKYYILGNTEIEVDHQNGGTRTLSYIGSQAIWEQSTTTGNHLYYLHQDYQGSLLAVTDESGGIVQRYAYDPWGRRRDPGTWRNLTASEIEQQSFLFARGYTGHEHLDAFGLINMNGRMYDPLLGRMLSPDNYVQAPGNSQNFNRYSYALNNPLVYTDPSGEFVYILPNIGLSKEGGLSVGLSLVFGIPGVASFQIGGGYNFKSNEPYAYAGASAMFNTAYTSISPSGGASVGYTVGMSPYSGFPISTNFATAGVDYNISNNSWSGNVSSWNIDKNGVTFNPSVSAMIYPEHTTNLIRGQGFRSNSGVFDRMNSGTYTCNEILDYFGFEGTYVPGSGNPGKTNLDGTIIYNEVAFSKNFDYLKFIASEEKFHQRDILSGNYDDVDWDDPVDRLINNGIAEWKAKMHQYKNQGLFLNSGEDIIGSINHYGIDAGYYYDPVSFFTKAGWHDIYRIRRIY